jgi:copper chaperone NosL
MNNDRQRYLMGKRLGKSNQSGSIPPLRRPTFAVGVLLACVMIGLCACQGTLDLKPSDITENDTCTFCKMPIAEVQYAAEFLTKDGFVRKFDTVSCMVQHANKVNKSSIAAYYVMDYADKQWVKGEDAFFVQSEKIATPMDSGIIAFKDKAVADSTASQYDGKVLSLNDILK